MRYYTWVHDKEFVIDIDHEHEITVNGQTLAIDFQQLAEAGLSSLLINHRSLEAAIEEREKAWEVLISGQLYSVRVQDERAYRLAQAQGGAAAAGEGDVRAPMPGIIIAVPIQVGDRVASGDQVVILESMKMENELRSPRPGVVLQIHVAPGQSVEKDQLLVVVGEDTGGEDTGSEDTGGEDTGSEDTGGESAGGESAGGESAGGESAGGESAGGGDENGAVDGG